MLTNRNTQNKLSKLPAVCKSKFLDLWKVEGTLVQFYDILEVKKSFKLSEFLNNPQNFCMYKTSLLFQVLRLLTQDKFRAFLLFLKFSVS